MKKIIDVLLLSAVAFLIVSCASGPGGNQALVSNMDASKIDSQSRAALAELYRVHPKAQKLANNSQGVLVFPDMKKGGLIVGGAWGDGVLYQRGKSSGFYRSVSASYGLQAGVQKYGYALFLMDQNAIDSLNKSGGWEVGSAPSLTVIDMGTARSLSTTTLNKGTNAVFFNQRGLMAGLSLQGTKVTRLAIEP